MKPPEASAYPDISEIIRRKAEGRRDLAKLSFGEKILRMEALRDRLAPFKALREEARATRSREDAATTEPAGSAGPDV